MSPYVVLVRFTEQGRKNVKQGPADIDKARKVAHGLGVTIESIFFIMGGPYDFLVHAQAPDDRAVTKFVLAAGMTGNADVETMRAFTEDDYRKIINELT
jgi:uncharacterized protein with GYD domain